VLSVATHFDGLSNWVGRETADLVYTDRTGTFTRYMTQNCVGMFPIVTRNYSTHPIEYYLEVKTSILGCSALFYMSNSQYKRVSHGRSRFPRSCIDTNIGLKMRNMALPVFGQPDRVYVIMRVYNLMDDEVGLKIYVDPWRHKGTKLKFKAEKWCVTAT